MTTKTPAAPKNAAVKPEANGHKTPEYGIEKRHDVPWCDKKVAVLKAMKTLKAFGASAAKSAKEIAEKAGVSTRDVRHYCYHAKVSGLTGVHELEGERGYSFSLTKKGQACDPVAELKKQEAE